MTYADIHQIADSLYVIEGHHPRALWSDPDIPSIVVYRCDETLYILDTGVGATMRSAIREVAGRLGTVDDVILLNSHGHVDHLGNNDVLHDIPAGRRAHYLPRASRPALDYPAFFNAMYKRGVGYFDYLSGLTLPPSTVASLVSALGPGIDVSADDLAALGAQIQRLGLSPVLSQFVPGAVIDLVLRTYPAVSLSVETMIDYEDRGPAAPIELGDVSWPGWTFGDGAVHVLLSEGHSAGGCVFFLPEHKFLMLADETTTAPIWGDSNPPKVADTARRALALMDGGELTTVCAGHRPMLPCRDEEARTVFEDIVAGAESFAAAVQTGLERHPTGIGIDRLYDELVAEAKEGSTIDLFHRLQFPVFGTFLKLTLLNQCLLSGAVEGRDAGGQPTFTVTSGSVGGAGRSEADHRVEPPASS